jgi:hypothetical protein
VGQNSFITGDLVVGTIVGHIFYSKKINGFKIKKEQEVVLVLIRESQALQIDTVLLTGCRFSRQDIIKLQLDT